ncbi:glycosyltransferase family 2 protein [Methylobacterium sp. J-092]|uniref:glycosyltransferase family 2 protein n=1 Tax=Methylobacterium sp. J-092 TaxID=2836667 RepID=UPI001FB9A368|nr:hypothetical protein [Methylobacterium sp. J-092]MCJ2006662.1 hypothetical protein [Methylobacterium sp. J-092]
MKSGPEGAITAGYHGMAALDGAIAVLLLVAIIQDVIAYGAPAPNANAGSRHSRRCAICAQSMILRMEPCVIGLVLTMHTHDPERLMQSVRESGEAVRWYIFLHKHNPALEDKLKSFAAANDAQLYLYRENRGLSRSWNEGIHQSMQDGCELTFVLNDDLHFVPGGFDAFVSHLREAKGWSLGFINGLEIGGASAGQVIVQGMACFAISHVCTDTVGYFDETFVPAYYEDIDYLRRMRLAGCQQTFAPGVLGEHLRMTTLGLNPDLQASMSDWHSRNEVYYTRKWGPLHHEYYDTPFGDPSLGLCIEWSSRADPYPGR